MEGRNNMTIRIQLLVCLLSAGVLIATMGCSQAESLPLEAESIPVENVEVEDEILPIETDLPDEEPKPKEFDINIEPFVAEAYLDVLAENSSILTAEHLSESQIRSGLDIGDGKVAIVDVFGDEAPELLYIHIATEYSINLNIFMYSKIERAVSIFDSNVYIAAGGEGNYCVYLTNDGELMLYYFRSDVVSWYGFWPIIPGQTQLFMYSELAGYDTYDQDLAQLFFADISVDSDNVETYMEYGEAISEEQFEKAGNKIIGDIAQVLFHGLERKKSNGEWYFGLYHEHFWNSITPFEENCMTYTEAVACLETQIGKQ